MRSCEEGEPARTCEYYFTVEWYFVLTKACYNCPFNKTDCYRPHCISADGFPRAVVVVNRMLPGPAIQVCENDEIVVTVDNKLNMAEGTTIHWHGIHQKGTPYNDGVEMLTQCPIPAHTQFQYRFIADTPGTHFWHSHAGLQRSDGYFGALIVRQTPSADVHFDRYDYDLYEHSILITDWLTEVSVNRFTHHHHDDGDNKPKSMLINGMGAYQEFFDHTTNQTVFTPKAEFKVSKGYRYRFRVISNGVLNCPILFSIDNHTLEVIASDGAPFEPYTVDSIVVYAGERFDFILTANETEANYWLRLQGLADCGPQFSMSKQTAILRYDGAPDGEDPQGETDYFSNAREGKQLNPLNTRETADMVPIAKMNASFPDDDVSGTPDKKFFIGMDFHKIDNRYFHDSKYYPVYAIERKKHLYTPQFNKITMKLPPSPPISQLDDLSEDLICNEDTVTKNCTEEHCECVHILQVKLNDLVEIIVVDEGVTFNANHPIHLHGHAYRVVGMDRVSSYAFIHRDHRKKNNKDFYTNPASASAGEVMLGKG
ncbi:uncharacterized protein LOC135479706 [Liolophura sinensis]|uniref:uncharacterized protein LOC135479706 n=1 Tax=Liolophura sinensis TaxID=3198878 RepID=UPI003158C6F8